MNMMYVKRVFICSGLMVLCLFITACAVRLKDHPAAYLQQAIASKLASPDACPTGDSKDIQQIVDEAGADRSVTLPEGCYQIASTIKLPACTLLTGAGADKTILYRQPGGHYSQPIIQISTSAESPCVTRVSGLSLIGVRDTHDTGEDYGISISNVSDFRIDHSYFEGFGFAGVRVQGNSRGVIDHSIFVDNYKSAIDNLGYGVVVYGRGVWDPEIQPGSAEATFVEDSLFIGQRHAIAANAGARYVFRNNQVLNGVEACAIDAHGMGFGSAHGTQYVEIYHNMISDPVYDECGIGIRGGSGVIFENTIIGYKNPILLILEWGTPDFYKSQYPARDQVQELYIWDNQAAGGQSEPQVDETGVDFIQPGRDFFTAPPAGYTQYEYPHPLANGSPFDGQPWPPGEE